MGALIQDIRYAGRGLRKSPGFAVTAIVTLAFGIGLCSVLYSVLNESFLRPLPNVPDPDRLAITQGVVAYPWFERYRDHSDNAWTASAFIGPVQFAIAFNQSGMAEPDLVTGLLVSPEYFSTLRVRPMLGRFFDAQHERVRAPAEVVVTERFWRTRLKADSGVIGRILRVNGRPAVIIGVGAPGFFGAGIAPFPAPEVFIPATTDPDIAPELQGGILRRVTQPAFTVLLRLDPGITIAGAEARLDAETKILSNSREKKDRMITLLPAGRLLPLPKEARTMIGVFYGVLIFVILGLICANLAGLLLARGAARRREFAIRLSLGADRLRLIRQLLTESAILAAAGGLAGFIAGNALFHVLRRLQTVSNPLIDDLTSGPDLNAAFFTFVISGAAVIGFALLPALAITRLDLIHVMKANLSTGLHRYRHFGLRNAFVICQVTAAMMLMLVMGFFVIGAQYGSRTEPGFDPGPISFFSIDPSRDGLSLSEAENVLHRLPDRLAQMSGVESVSLTDQPPLSNTYPNTTVSVPSLSARSVAIQHVGPGFLGTLGATILRGTDFQDRGLLSEDASRKILPVAINQTAAADLFGPRDPLGARIRQDERTFQVAAVVRYAPRAMLMGRPIPIIFAPLTAKDVERLAAGETIVVIRARTQISIAELRAQLAAIDARLTLFHPETMRQYVAESDRVGSRIATLYAPFGLFGLVLACLGLAGVTAQTVQRRTKEIGIRTALGAQRSQVLRLVMGEGTAMVVIGAAFGYVVALGFIRVLSAVSAPVVQIVAPVASNPALTVGIPSFLVVLAVIACYVPARRSASIDPLEALREE